LLAGDVDAFPRFQGLESVGQFQSDPHFKVTVGGTEGKTILSINTRRNRSTMCGFAAPSLTRSTAKQLSMAHRTVMGRRSAAI